MSISLAIVGCMWGDEGKGKIVDYYSKMADIVVRYHGGHNSGHTIVVGNNTYVLHIIPSGAIRENSLCFITSGVVINPDVLIEEIQKLENLGIKIKHRLKLSNRIPILFDFHAKIDKLREESKKNNKIGTTHRGVGPAYEDFIARRAILIGDLLYKDYLAEKLELTLKHNSDILIRYGEEPLNFDYYLEYLLSFYKSISHMIVDTGVLLTNAYNDGKFILFEGAQGALLDINHGTYPYVTSSNCLSSNACISSGISPKYLDKVLGVTKAYTTRVGRGPFPSEIFSEEADIISSVGKEYGATTGRKRRCGWLDMPALKRSVLLNGIDSLCVTKLDILDSFDEIKICKYYRNSSGDIIDIMPSNNRLLFDCQPEYITIQGWQSNTENIRLKKDLPYNLLKYLNTIEEILSVPIELITTGADRENIINMF